MREFEREQKKKKKRKKKKKEKEKGKKVTLKSSKFICGLMSIIILFERERIRKWDWKEMIGRGRKEGGTKLLEYQDWAGGWGNQSDQGQLERC